MTQEQIDQILALFDEMSRRLDEIARRYEDMIADVQKVEAQQKGGAS